MRLSSSGWEFSCAAWEDTHSDVKCDFFFPFGWFLLVGFVHSHTVRRACASPSEAGEQSLGAKCCGLGFVPSRRTTLSRSSDAGGSPIHREKEE